MLNLNNEPCLPDLDPWRRAHLAPVSRALYRKDRPAALAALQAAWQALELGSLDSPQREALGLNWHYHAAQCAILFASGEEALRGALEAGLAALQAPVVSAAARAEQNSMLLFLRVSMMRRGLRPYPPEEFEAHYMQVPEALRHTYFWHQVSGWAFAQRDLPRLSDSLAALSSNPPREDAESFWQRTNLMYHLVLGDAKERDVEQYISLLRLDSMAAEFSKHIWPRVVEAGLASPRLEQRLSERLAALAARGPQVPEPSAATRSALSRHLRPAGC